MGLLGRLFGKKTSTAPLLLAAVVVRPNFSASGAPSLTPEGLVSHLNTFHDAVEKAARVTGGNVVQFVGDFSLVAWRCGLGTGGCTVDPIGTGRKVLEVIRSQLPLSPESPICVGLALGECVYQEQWGRVLSAMGHIWLRLAKDFRPSSGGEQDAIVLDRSLLASVSPDQWVEVGDGWYRAPAERVG